MSEPLYDGQLTDTDVRTLAAEISNDTCTQPAPCETCIAVAATALAMREARRMLRFCPNCGADVSPTPYRCCWSHVNTFYQIGLKYLTLEGQCRQCGQSFTVTF